MPKDFLTCVNSGGKVITKKLNQNEYIHLCKDEKGWHRGEVKKTKKAENREKIKKVLNIKD